MINDQSGRMATELPTTNGQSAQNVTAQDSFTVKTGLARMLKGGVIMDVVNAEQVSLTPIPSFSPEET
jgi:pyridoxal 5'-phosphate synthase pdxS subunit